MKRHVGITWSGVLALAIILLGWVHPLVHLGTVAHGVCTEHGEIAHGGHGHGPAATVQVEGTERVAILESPRGAEEIRHEHCSHPSFDTPKKSFTSGSCLRGATGPAGPRRSLLDTERVDFAPEVWRLAPKQSPPAVA